MAGDSRQSRGTDHARRWASLTLILCLGGMVPKSQAEEFIIVGPRAMGMGGAGVATTRGALSTYWNPAALAPPKTPRVDTFFDVELHLSATGNATEDVIARVNDLADLLDSVDFEGYEQAFEDGRALTPQELQDLFSLTDRISDIGAGGTGLVANVTPGLNVRIGRFGLSAMALVNVGGLANVDTNLLALGNDGLSTLITGTNAAPPGTEDFAAGIEQDLLDRGLPAGEASRLSNEIAFQANSAGVNVDDPNFQSLLDDIVDATIDAAGDPTLGTENFFSSNGTGVDIRGIALQEYGLSYAHPFLGIVSVGATAKLLYGRTYYNPFTLDDLANFSDVFDEVTNGLDDDQLNFAVDIGVLAQPLDFLSVGIVGKYLNTPSFDFPGPGDYDIDPQVRAGGAVGPFAGFTFALDLDLTNNNSEALPGYTSQTIGGGLEYNLYDILFLRGGVSKNLAESAQDPTIHAGLGLRIPGVGIAFDLAGMFSTEFVEIDESTDIPESAGASVLFSVMVPLD